MEVDVAVGGRAEVIEVADDLEQVAGGFADELDEELLLALEVLVESGP